MPTPEDQRMVWALSCVAYALAAALLTVFVLYDLVTWLDARRARRRTRT